jgi:hypothetical protein
MPLRQVSFDIVEPEGYMLSEQWMLLQRERQTPYRRTSNRTA